MLALLAVIALAMAATIGATAGASGGHAVAAKKGKCKKKKAKKGDAQSAKKKGKCKKKKPSTKPTSAVRATLTYDSETPGVGDPDLDLYVFDASGNKGSAKSNAIPNSAFSADALDGPGTETFTDLAAGGSVQTRDLSFGVCYRTGGSNHVIYTIDYVTADGVHHTDTVNAGSSGFTKGYPGGPAIPLNFCGFV
jgi:hypothetical protein